MSKKGKGSPTLQGERNYQTARGLFGGYFETDEEVQDRVIRNALAPRFARQKKEVGGIVSLAGSVNLFRFLGRVTISRNQGIDLFKRKERELSRFTLTRQEAAAKFIATLNARGSKISDARPNVLKRRKTTSRAAPEHGSFKRDINMTTKITGAVRTDKAMNRFIASLQGMINSFRNLDNSGKAKKFKLPTITVKKTIGK